MDKGWIKLNRQIQDHWIWSNHEYAFAWIDLLLLVNHENRKIMVNGIPTVIKRGQTLTSIKKLAARWGWSRNTVYRFLNALERDKMITRVGTSNGTTLTIENYGKFQDKGNTNGTPNRTSSGTTSGTLDGTQTRKNKNEKEIKESAPLVSDETATLEDEEPPVPGAVRMPNGGWNYRPDLDWDDEDEE